ncbi:MAG: hypothetical protein H0W87_08020, partial [Actinobacteria bacterium]|nr:hypothetical protein [Actinomycetota bacterium]
MSRGLHHRQFTLTIAAAAALALGMSSPATAAKPKKGCTKAQVTVLVKKKRTCMSARALGRLAPGTDLADLLVRASADKSLWRGSTKAAAGVLGKHAEGVFAFDVALLAASRSVGKPLVPREPTPPANRTKFLDETLGLDVSKTPIGWVQKQAERVESWKEKVGGEQERKAETKGTLLAAGGSGEYQLRVAEEFNGDPCPQAGGVVEATASYSVERTVDGLFGQSTENVATVKVLVKAKVGKKGALLDYTLTANFFSEGGGWTAAGHTNKGAAKPGKILTPSDIASVDLTGKLDAKTQQKVAAAMYKAILLAKQKADLWLVDAQKIWLDKAACKKVTGTGLGTLKPGQEREVEVNIQSIRGAKTDEDVELSGRNGLQVVSPTGKVTAKGGKVKVKVKAANRRFLATGAAAPYVLDVEGLSELGRGLGALPFKQVVGYRFSGLKYRGEVHDIVYGTSYSQYEVIDARFCGEDPYTEPWTMKIQEDSDWPLFGGHTFHGTVD